MSHSFNKIWIHALWGTKDRKPLIAEQVEDRIYRHMASQFRETGCPLRIVNGMPDHVHCLFLANPAKTLNDIIKQVKGSTSHWVNDQNLIEQKFVWQTGFAAYSVSESVVGKLYRYIANQKYHHRYKDFLTEYDEFIKMHGLVREDIAGKPHGGKLP